LEETEEFHEMPLFTADGDEFAARKLPFNRQRKMME
jgi:hypothetical protein